MAIGKTITRYFLLILMMSLTGMSHAAQEPVEMKASCAQLKTIVSTETNPNNALLFLMYKALSNGQASRYNQALLQASYSKPLVDAQEDHADTALLKQVIAHCQKDNHPTDNIAETILLAISQNIQEKYPNQQLTLTFKTPLSNGQSNSAIELNAQIIGLGQNTCESALSSIDEQPIYQSFYTMWAAGYLTPYIMTLGLSPQEEVAFLEQAFEQSFQYCEQHPQTLFSSAILAQ